MFMLIERKDVETGVSIATLGSIAIVISAFLQSSEKFINYSGPAPSPINAFMLAGFILIFSATLSLLARMSTTIPKTFSDVAMELGLATGLFAYLCSTIFTFVVWIT